MDKKVKNFEPSDNAKKIRRLRKLKGCSQKKLADISKISRATIQNIEKGKHSGLDKTLGILFDALKGLQNAPGKKGGKTSEEEDEMGQLKIWIEEILSSDPDLIEKLWKEVKLIHHDVLARREASSPQLKRKVGDQ